KLRRPFAQADRALDEDAPLVLREDLNEQRLLLVQRLLLPFHRFLGGLLRRLGGGRRWILRGLVRRFGDEHGAAVRSVSGLFRPVAARRQQQRRDQQGGSHDESSSVRVIVTEG